MCPVPARPRQPPALPPVGSVQLWPQRAQFASAFLLGAAVALVGVRAYQAWGSRPTFCERSGAYRIDLNRADRAELLQLPGVGDSMAERILTRQRDGGFATVADLRRVKGVGPATLERLRPWVAVSRDSNGPVPGPSLDKAPVRKAARKEDALSAPVDVNRASADELQRLPGVGPKMARRITDERGRAPFRSADDLRRVSGIGPKTLERLRPFVSVSPDKADQLTASTRK